MEAILEEPLHLAHTEESVWCRISCLDSQQLPRTAKPLLIIAEEHREAKPLPTLVVNASRCAQAWLPSKAPGSSDRRKGHARRHRRAHQWSDLIHRDAGLKRETPKLEMLGTARRITIRQRHTTNRGR